ncbi:MAG: aminotransferase class I/II-fold pyridoxal phosphate-dependent enzyme [Candidatus Berkelbacteria bacterium]
MSSLREEVWYTKLSAAVETVYPHIRVISGSATDPEIIADGQKVLLFCSPNYLGLSNDFRICQSFHEAVNGYGVGTNGSGIVSGYTDIHKQLEEKFAAFMNEESAVFFNAVSDASAGVITSVVSPPLLSLYPGSSSSDLGDVAVFCDVQNHASLFDAVKLSQPDKTFVYHHCDVEYLEKCLQRSTHKRKLIITDGYFSMSARVAPLPEIINLANTYGALVLVDDAHGDGVLGNYGRGTLEYFGISNDTCLKVHSVAKAYGVRGGLATGDLAFTRYLRVSARRYMFSGTLPAAIPAAVCTALDIAQKEPWRRRQVLANAEYVRQGLLDLGYTVLGEKHIVPWFIGDDTKADAVSTVLEDHGIFASSIRYPAVPKGEALIRFMPMATHTKEHLDRLLAACKDAGQYL